MRRVSSLGEPSFTAPSSLASNFDLNRDYRIHSKTLYTYKTSSLLEQRSRELRNECHTFNRTASNKTLLFSLLLGLLLKLQFRVQLADVILEVLLGLLKKAKHEEDLVMHKI